MDDVEISSCSNFSSDKSTAEGVDISLMLQAARCQGLTSDQIMKVIYAIESENNRTEDKLEFMKCLIPLKSIPGEAVIRMTCLLISFRVSMGLKVEILKWMITVYSFVEESQLDEFQSLYEIFLQLLEKVSLQPFVCHLLYLISQKGGVTQRRVNYLQRLLKKYGHQPCLVFLLNTYYKLRPASFNEEITDNIKYRLPSLGIFPRLIKRVHPSYDLNASCYVNDFESSDEPKAKKGCGRPKGSKKPAKEANQQFHSIFQEFQVLRKSTNVSKILNSKYRRLFLTSDIPLKSKVKIYDFLLSSLYDNENFSSRDFLLNILGIFHDLEGSFVGISHFTEMLISSFDGRTNLDIITGLLQYEPICCFKKIEYKMELIYEHLLKASIPIKCELFYCISKMYENWILMQHDRFSFIPCSDECSDSTDNSVCASHQPVEEIYKLGRCIDYFCNGLIVDDFFKPCLLNEVLLHYERVSIIHTKVDDLDVHFPTSPVFHAALFSLSSVTLDNLGRLMLRYNAEIKHMRLMESEEADLAVKLLHLLAHDMHNILRLEHEEEIEDTYLSETNVFSRLKAQYPNIRDLLVLHKHPALLVASASFLTKHPNYKSCRGLEFKRAFQNYLTEEGLKHFIKFVNLP